MNESKILRTASDAEWYAHAYSEYLADVSQNISSLMAAIQETLTLESITVSVVSDILLSHGINPDARFIIGEYGQQTALALAMNSWYDLEMPDGYVNEHPYSIEEIFSIIRGSWTQAVISSKAFESFAITMDNTVDRVSKFIQDVQAHFNIDDSVRDVVAYYQSMINASPQVGDFVNSYIKATGVDDADVSNDPMAYVNSDIYKYTGNTPGIALDFSTVNNAVNTTVSVAAQVVKGVFNIAVKGATWLFNKAKKYVVDTVIDPMVCEYIGDDNRNSGYIDGFAWYGEFTPNVSFSHYNTGAQISQTFAGFYDDYAEKWIKIKLKIGEFLFRIVSNDTKWQCYFKPVAVDLQYLQDNYTGSYIEPTYTVSNHDESINNYNQWLLNLMEFIQPVSKDATKEQIYQGLCFSTTLVGSICMFAFLETYNLVNGSPIVNADNSNSLLTDLSIFFTFEPALDSNKVTNSKILLAAAGNPNETDNINYYLSWNSTTGANLINTISKYSIRTVMTDIISVWAMCRTERKLYPANYTFVPYSNNHTSFSPSSWRIKSDSDIADTRDNFLEKVILAVIIVAAAVFIGATAIKISKNAFFKRQQTLGALENKMWNGGKLTPAERKKYIRYNRKQNASQWLNAGSSNTNNALSNNSQSIITLIQG